MKSILLIGLGRFGRHVAEKLYELDHQVMAVDKQEDRVEAVMSYVTNAQIGDSTNMEFLETLGVSNFDVCIVAIASDFQSSLETTAYLKDLGAKMVVSRASRAVCTALAVTVLAGGVAMFNNYKKMHEMESVIASVLPEGRIKEAKAGVWPIEEKFPKVTVGEKPSFVTPETMREAAETETAVISSEAPENVPEETALMETEEADAPAYKVYTVGEGETLYGICFKVYQNVNKLDEICRINELRDQNSIYAGQKLLMP